MSTISPIKYGYSNTRVKAMEAKLIGSAAMQGIISAKDVGTVLSALVNTDYNKSLIEYGGVQIKQSLIDFALSKNFAEKMAILVKITPKNQQHIVRGLVSRFDLSNVKLAIEAKERGLSYEQVSPYIIDYGEYDQHAIKEAFKEDSVHAMLVRFAKGSPYAQILKAAIAADAEKKDAGEIIAAIDTAYYKSYGYLIEEMHRVSDASGRILRMEVDMRNAITLIRAKRRSMKADELQKYLIPFGSITESKLKSIYSNASNVETMVKELDVPGLKEGLEGYQKTKQLISFEIGMRSSIFNTAVHRLRGSVLSFSTIIAYIYLKEMEVFTLRILIKSKAYNLGKDEVSRLITWKLN